MRPKSYFLIFFNWVYFIAILQAQSYSDYYQKINSAELALSDSNWTEAAQFYQKAFEIGVKPFGKDLHNAIVTNIEIDSFYKTVKYCEQLFFMNTPLTYFEFPVFSKLTKSSYWETIKTLSKRTVVNVNKPLKKELMKRYKKDQAVDDPNRSEYFMITLYGLKI
jgi:hypothetical protein